MLRQSTSDCDHPETGIRVISLRTALMGGTGAALVGVGLLLGLRHGSVVSFGEGVLTVVAMCL